MGLNTSKGNMYSWITHTWNTVKGQCYHDCSYCYMKKWGNLRDIRFDESELNTNLGEDKFIFVGSSCDMFAEDINPEWIIKTLIHCKKYNDNFYLFQTKNPKGFNNHVDDIVALDNFGLCVTIETNRWYEEFMRNSPKIKSRVCQFSAIPYFNKYITIEPIMDFDLIEFVDMLRYIKPIQINIGADSGGNKLPEPSKEKILQLISELEKFTTVKQKKNLNRILNG